MFKSSVTAQEELVCTRKRLPFASIRSEEFSACVELMWGKERLPKFHTLEKCEEFFVWFSSSDDCVEKCEEICCSQFHTCKMWGNWRWAGEMWGNPFLTSEDVRKYTKSLLAINFNVRKMWGIFFHMCGKEHLGHRNQKESFGWIFQNLDFLLSCSCVVFRWPQLNFNAMWQKPICVLEVGWEPLRSVISLPSEVVSGSLLRLLKFLPVFKLAVRFAASSALMRSASLPWEWSWS